MIEMRKVGNVSLNMILNWRLYIKSELDATKKNCNCWLMDTVELPGLKSKGDPRLNKTHI